MLELKVRYFDDKMPELVRLPKGDWIDVRVASVEINGKYVDWGEDRTIEYKIDDVVTFHLGMAIQLPDDHEAWLLPRSGTFKNYGVMLTNSKGVVDETYCGNDDEWKMMYLAKRNGMVTQYDRIGQFRIMRKMEALTITKVDYLDNENRGGYGSTGVK